MTNIASFPDEISIEQIVQSKFDCISYQNVKRAGRGERQHHSTSFFINSNFLLTSAHNVTKLFFGKNKPNKLSIFPSRIGNELHRGSIVYEIDYNKNIILAPGYSFMKRKTRIPHDIALIYVPDDIIAQNSNLTSIPYLPILEDMSSLQEGECIYCAGYPAADEYKGAFKMTLDESVLGHVYNNSFKHRLDTKPGNSGSPIMVKRSKQFYVIGVNSIKYNGTLINKMKKEWIQQSIDAMS